MTRLPLQFNHADQKPVPRSNPKVQQPLIVLPRTPPPIRLHVSSKQRTPIRFRGSSERFAMFSASTPNYSWQYDVTNPYKEAYCRKWGYEFVFVKYHRGRRHPVWDRIPFVRELLDTGKYDYVMWIDVDAAPVEFEISLEMILDRYDPNRDKSFVISHERRKGTFNNGIALYRNDKWMREFLDRWGSDATYRKWDRVFNREQQCFQTWWNNEPELRRHVCNLPYGVLNACTNGGDHWEHGILCRHFCCHHRGDSTEFARRFAEGLDFGKLAAYGLSHESAIHPNASALG